MPAFDQDVTLQFVRRFEQRCLGRRAAVGEQQDVPDVADRQPDDERLIIGRFRFEIRRAEKESPRGPMRRDRDSIAARKQARGA